MRIILLKLNPDIANTVTDATAKDRLFSASNWFIYFDSTPIFLNITAFPLDISVEITSKKYNISFSSELFYFIVAYLKYV